MGRYQFLQVAAMALRALHGFITVHDQCFKLLIALFATVFVDGHGNPPKEAKSNRISFYSETG